MAVPPLNIQLRIVDDEGRPTPEFIQWWQRQLGENAKIIPLTTAEEVSAVLDVIGNTQGSILYRTTSGWALLAPGTDGYVLTTKGAGADPEWALVEAGAGAFLDLTDTPGDYTGQGEKVVSVKADETGLEFTDGGGGGGVGVHEETVSIDLAALSANEAIVAVNGAEEIFLNVQELSNAGSEYTRLQVSIDGGSTWLNTSGDYKAIVLSEGFGDGNYRTNFQIIGSTSGSPASARAEFYGLQSANEKRVDILQYRADAWIFSGVVVTASAITHIRLYTDDGSNFSGGDLVATRRFYQPVSAGAAYPLGFAKFTKPGDTFTAYNNGSPDENAYNSARDTWRIQHTGDSGDSFAMKAGLTTDGVVIMRLHVHWVNENFISMGVVYGENSSGRRSTLAFSFGNELRKQFFNGLTYVSETVVTPGGVNPSAYADNPYVYFKLERIGTDIEASISRDGLNWLLVFTGSTTENTMSDVDEVGVYINSASATGGRTMWLEVFGYDIAQQDEAGT